MSRKIAESIECENAKANMPKTVGNLEELLPDIPESHLQMASSHLFASITFSKEGAPHQNFFVGRSEGGGAVFFISKNLPLKGKFFEMVSFGGLGGLAPPGISNTRALPPGGVWGAWPPRNLR